MTVLDRLAKGAAYTLIASILIKLMMLVQSIIIARLLGPSDLGIFSILGNLQAMASLMATFSIPVALTRYIAASRSNEEAGHILSTSIILIFFLSLFSSIIYYFSAGYFSNLYNEPILVSLIAISALVVIVNAYADIGNYLLQGLHQITLLSKINTIKTPIAITLFVFFTYFYGLIGAVIASLLAAIINICIYLFYLPPHTKGISLNISTNKIMPYKTLINYSTPTFLAVLLLPIVSLYANSLLAINIGFEAVGLFRIASTLSSVLLFIPSAICIPLFPLISELDSMNKDKLSHAFSEVTKTLILILLPLTVVMGLFSKIIIELLYGSTYSDAWFPTFIMTITTFVISIGLIQGNFLQGTAKVWGSLLLNVLWAISFVILLNLFIEKGINGIAYAYLISYLFYVLILTMYIRIKLGIEFRILKKLFIHTASIFSISYFIIQLLNNYAFIFASILLIIITMYVGFSHLNSKEKTVLISFLNNKKDIFKF